MVQIIVPTLTLVITMIITAAGNVAVIREKGLMSAWWNN